MSDTRRNLQVKQPGIEGYDISDGNGWPVPLVDPSNEIKMVVTDGKRGEQRNFQAMSTSGQGDTPEGKAGEGTHAFDQEMSISIKKTENDSRS